MCWPLNRNDSGMSNATTWRRRGVDPVAAAIMRAQLSVFEEQFASLHQSMRSCAQLTGVDPLSPSAPPDARYLQQSEGSSNAPKAADGVAVLAPDGLEIKLANHLDAQGGLAKAQQVESFLQLCAKAASPERQALLLAVLQCTTGTMQLARFVQLGGLKVLRGWLRDAAMSNHTQLTGTGSRRAPRASGHGGGGARVRNRQGGEEDPQTVARGGDGDPRHRRRQRRQGRRRLARRRAHFDVDARAEGSAHRSGRGTGARGRNRTPEETRAPAAPLVRDRCGRRSSPGAEGGAGCRSGQHGIERRASRHQRGEREQG